MPESVIRRALSSANLGTLKEDAVNIALHGHNPVLSEVLIVAADSRQEDARVAGANMAGKKTVYGGTFGILNATTPSPDFSPS